MYRKWLHRIRKISYELSRRANHTPDAHRIGPARRYCGAPLVARCTRGSAACPGGRRRSPRGRRFVRYELWGASERPALGAGASQEESPVKIIDFLFCFFLLFWGQVVVLYDRRWEKPVSKYRANMKGFGETLVICSIFSQSRVSDWSVWEVNYPDIEQITRVSPKPFIFALYLESQLLHSPSNTPWWFYVGRHYILDLTTEENIIENGSDTRWWFYAMIYYFLKFAPSTKTSPRMNILDRRGSEIQTLLWAPKIDPHLEAVSPSFRLQVLLEFYALVLPYRMPFRAGSDEASSA